VPDTPLLVAGSFARLPAGAVADAIASGLRTGGWHSIDVAALGDAAQPAGTDFDARMRGARALVIAQRGLAEADLRGSPAFELATRARQAGVPCFAVTARNRLSAFDARMLDLQVVLEAGTRAALVRAGRALAAVL
jgi:glycerate kinase